MQPLAVMLGIVMGSAVSIAVGLALTLIVFLALPEYQDRLQGEFVPLMQYFVISVALAAVAALSFIGELRQRSWRRSAQGLLAVIIVAIIFSYYFRVNAV